MSWSRAGDADGSAVGGGVGVAAALGCRAARLHLPLQVQSHAVALSVHIDASGPPSTPLGRYLGKWAFHGAGASSEPKSKLQRKLQEVADSYCPSEHECVQNLHVFICTCKYVYVHIYTYMHVSLSLSLYIYIYICVYVHICIYVYIYTQDTYPSAFMLAHTYLRYPTPAPNSSPL